MQRSRRGGSAARVEMKPLFFFFFLFFFNLFCALPQNSTQLQLPSCFEAAIEQILCMQIRVTQVFSCPPPPDVHRIAWNLRFNGRLSVRRVFANTCVAFRRQRQRVQRRECLFRSTDDYGSNYIRTSARPLRVCKHHLQITWPSLHASLKDSSFVVLWLRRKIKD